VVESLALFDLNPVHIGFVLMLALILFGPQKLPEIGKQLGNALRELKKAGREVASSFSTDHEPEYRPYSDYGAYPNYSSGYEAPAYTAPRSLEPPLDLTDYTLAGQTPAHSQGTAAPNPAVDDSGLASAYDNWLSSPREPVGAPSASEGDKNA